MDDRHLYSKQHMVEPWALIGKATVTRSMCLVSFTIRTHYRYY
ncbi:hypothetical protein OH492_08255 [Vibrio chagasii]|nr:hypothetical protein [Vibrio chagasii]